MAYQKIRNVQIAIIFQKLVGKSKIPKQVECSRNNLAQNEMSSDISRISRYYVRPQTDKARRSENVRRKQEALACNLS